MNASDGPFAVEIPTKNADDIVDAIQIRWFGIYGKPELMIWDGERAIVSIEAAQWASRNQLQLPQRAGKKGRWWLGDRMKSCGTHATRRKRS